MYLADVDIGHAIEAGEIQISPAVKAEDIRPAGIRLHLADTIAMPISSDAKVVDFAAPECTDFKLFELPREGYVLKKREFILASTVETVQTSPNILAQLDGRSTMARIGVMIHCGSSVIDNVHEEARAITLEIANLGPYDVRLRAGDAIGMLIFSYLTNNVQQPANPQYRGQVMVTPPVVRSFERA
ncbi:dCTP deaminase [Bradyrhizobium sp. INPA03-11B]|uniref:dCTP deaminase n=1 Tax=Bradyrhizobium sp. INPA03-11B TaxID=418598 RepID=UPI00338E9E3B